VFEEKGREKKFCKNVGSHVGGRDPSHLERAVRDMIVEKVISNINVFRMGGDCFGFCEGDSPLIVTKKRERVRNLKDVLWRVTLT